MQPQDYRHHCKQDHHLCAFPRLDDENTTLRSPPSLMAARILKTCCEERGTWKISPMPSLRQSFSGLQAVFKLYPPFYSVDILCVCFAELIKLVFNVTYLPISESDRRQL
jgi:hypothetical protein